MNWVAGSSHNSWQPAMTADTTTSSYWLNWRVLVCATLMSSSVAAALVLIWKYKDFNSNKRESGSAPQESVGSLRGDESWRPCLKEIHPTWLLAYRIIAFVVLLTLLVINAVVDGGDIFYFYTQWTFTLVTIYFGLGSLLSIHGCHQFLSKIGGDRTDETWPDAEQGTHVTSRNGSNADTQRSTKNSSHQERHDAHQTSRIWGHVFQVIYQTCAGAVMLTDIVFWAIIFPFRTANDYNLNFLLVSMHSINALFLLGDAAINCLRFPWFRISYFILWTSMYVIFQWLIHACIAIWWSYPFLDLSSPYAPMWYLSVALLHIPCYAIFALLIKTKHYLLSRRFPQSYQCQ